MPAPADPNADDGPLVSPGLPRTLSEPPAAGRVLVVAPHPDDETLGVGGTLALHADRGDPVHALFVTTGVNGDVEKVLTPEDYIELRRSEARAAAELLGIQETIFWDFPDSCVVTGRDLAHLTARMLEVYEQLQPSVVYAPHAGETHSDHHFVSRAVGLAHAAYVEGAAEGGAARLFGYEVWSPLVPDVLVDVTPVYDRKRRAIEAYASQSAHSDILGAMEGMNRFRSVLLPEADGGGGWRAEAFLELA